MLYPMKFEPIYIKKIWAGNKLKKMRPANLEESIGISWEISGHKNALTKVSNGKYKGLNLKELVQMDKTKMLGKNVDESEILRVAYLDAADGLSIQVHPTDDFSRIHENDGGKTEAWYILEADEGAYITAETTVDNIDVIKQALKKDKLEDYVMKIPVKKGDFVMIPAGLIHALGKGILAIEIGQNSDITYRLYDYNRGRKLDIEKSFSVLNPKLKCEKCEMGEHSSQHGKKYKKSICFKRKEFVLEVIDINSEYEDIANGERYHIYSCVAGRCIIEFNSGNEILNYGENVFIPAKMGNYKIKGTCRVLKSYIP